MSNLGKNVAEGQRDDILALGHVILALATRTIKESELSRQHSTNHAIKSVFLNTNTSIIIFTGIPVDESAPICQYDVRNTIFFPFC